MESVESTGQAEHRLRASSPRLSVLTLGRPSLGYRDTGTSGVRKEAVEEALP